MQRIHDAENNDDAKSDEPDWRASLANVRARFREELGNQSIDFTEIIREMREERDIQLLSNIYGEDEAIAMVRGRTHPEEETDDSSASS